MIKEGPCDENCDNDPYREIILFGLPGFVLVFFIGLVRHIDCRLMIDDCRLFQSSIINCKGGAHLHALRITHYASRLTETYPSGSHQDTLVGFL